MTAQANVANNDGTTTIDLAAKTLEVLDGWMNMKAEQNQLVMANNSQYQHIRNCMNPDDISKIPLQIRSGSQLTQDEKGEKSSTGRTRARRQCVGNVDPSVSEYTSKANIHQIASI